MDIAQISDTHILARSSSEPASASRAENLRRCIVDINRQGVDVVIHTGDGVHNGLAEEYAYLREILSDLEAPVFLIPGNRDRREPLRTAFGHCSYLPENGDFLHYTVENYPVRLIGLDSVDEGDRKGAFGAPRIVWLEETLAREPDKPTILFMHHPPFDVGRHYVGGYRQPQDAEALAEVVRRHPQVRRLICGHVHCQHETSWAGTVATVMPSVAVDRRMEVDVAVKDAPVYLLHVASRDGTVVSHTRVLTH